MGIFSFLSKEADEEDEDELLEEEQPHQPVQPVRSETAPTGQLFEGMRLDAMTKDGIPILTGRITQLTEDTLTMGRLPGDLSFKVVPINSSVSLNGYDKKLIPISLSAVVSESTRTVFSLKDLKVESHSENRDTFRLPYTAPVSLYRKEDDHYKNPEECQLVNISTGGCCVESEYIHMEDEVLRIRVKLDEYAPLNFLGQIVRCVEHSPGKFWYGVLFAQLTEQETASLSKTLYNLQMGVKQTHMRTMDKVHW